MLILVDFEDEMQEALEMESGRMLNLSQIHHVTEDERRLAAAQRVDHYAVRKPLAENVENYKKLHANFQVLEETGVVREYMAGGEQDISRHRATRSNSGRLRT
ncbi:hypothetical protein BDW72DRAFT_197215 [Aspergillus terricola var. indicus]